MAGHCFTPPPPSLTSACDSAFDDDEEEEEEEEEAVSDDDAPPQPSGAELAEPTRSMSPSRLSSAHSHPLRWLLQNFGRDHGQEAEWGSWARACYEAVGGSEDQPT